MNNFINLFSKLYPCKYCAKDFQEEIKKDPPKVESRENLSIWMCEMHNNVNKKLNKKTIDCKIDLLDEMFLGIKKKKNENN